MSKALHLRYRRDSRRVVTYFNFRVRTNVCNKRKFRLGRNKMADKTHANQSGGVLDVYSRGSERKKKQNDRGVR